MTYTTAIVGLDNTDNIIVSVFTSKTWYDAPPYVEQATKVFADRLDMLHYLDELTTDNIQVQDFTATPPQTSYYRTAKEKRG